MDLGISSLLHPDIPRERSGLLVGHGVAGQLQDELDLTVVVTLVPEHVLKKEYRVVIVECHLLARLHPVHDHVTHSRGALIQQLRKPIAVAIRTRGPPCAALRADSQSRRFDAMTASHSGYASRRA